MMPALSIAAQYHAQPTVDASSFKAYLLQSLCNPFVMNLEDATLMEVIRACISSKSLFVRGDVRSVTPFLLQHESVDYASLVNFLLAAALVTPDLTATALTVVVALRVIAPL